MRSKEWRRVRWYREAEALIQTGSLERDEPWRLKILRANSGAAPQRRNGSAGGDTTHAQPNYIDVCICVYAPTH